LGTSESHHKISKDNDVPQSLIYGTSKNGVISHKNGNARTGSLILWNKINP
jgi:hypothetical protein